MLTRLHHIPKLIRLATLFTLHFSLFTLHYPLFKKVFQGDFFFQGDLLIEGGGGVVSGSVLFREFESFLLVASL